MAVQVVQQAVATALLCLSGLAFAHADPGGCYGYGCAELSLTVGDVKGNVWTNGEEYLTVPYASAKRFEPPVMSTALPGGAYDATNILGLGQAACLQPGPPYTPGSNNAYYGVENCLFLNMYKPRGNSTTLRPVLLWVFGGDNTASEIIPYNATKLAGQHNAIVIVVSYRLGAMGFSAFKEDERSEFGTGNNGMHDIITAAKWIKKEAGNLGADPNRIVVFGESSGATDAQIMTMVPAAKGLVSGSIAESGGLYANDLKDALESTEAMARAVNCDGAFHPIKECMQNKTGKELTALLAAAGNENWGPTVDGVFLLDQPRDLVEQGKLNPGVSILWGANTNDSTKPYMLEQYVGHEAYLADLNDTIYGYTPPGIAAALDMPTKKIAGHRHLRRVLEAPGPRNSPAHDGASTPNATALLERAKILYEPHKFGDKGDPFGNNAALIATVWSDIFLCGAKRQMVAASKAVTSQGGKAFLYRFNWLFQSDSRCIADSNYHTPASGSNHCDEMSFVYGQPIFDNQDAPGYSYTNCSDPASVYYDEKRCVGCQFDKKEAALSAALGHFWSQFAATGQPALGDVWPAFTAEAPSNIVLQPGSSFVVEQNMGRPEACALWDEVEAFNNVDY